MFPLQNIKSNRIIKTNSGQNWSLGSFPRIWCIFRFVCRSLPPSPFEHNRTYQEYWDLLKLAPKLTFTNVQFSQSAKLRKLVQTKNVCFECFPKEVNERRFFLQMDSMLLWRAKFVFFFRIINPSTIPCIAFRFQWSLQKWLNFENHVGIGFKNDRLSSNSSQPTIIGQGLTFNIDISQKGWIHPLYEPHTRAEVDSSPFFCSNVGSSAEQGSNLCTSLALV